MAKKIQKSSGLAKNNSGHSRIEKKLDGVLQSALKALGVRNAEAAVFLVRGADLKQIKRRYYKKGKSGGLDVFSFPEPGDFPHPESKKRFLGEIYLNRGLQNDFPRLAFLLIHGLLHLLHYSHDKNRDTMKMQSLEKRLMKASIRSWHQTSLLE